MSDAMIRATSVRSAGLWPAERAADRITLDFDQRHRRRLRLQGEAGCAFLLDLAEARLLRNGDALQLEDGRLVEVRAAPERLAELTCADPLALARLAWHLGNRHCPTQILPGSLRIRWDHVLADMARGLGARVREIESPFDPEGGAYAQGHGHGHD